MQKTPRRIAGLSESEGGPFFIVSAVVQAARVAVSATASGTGPQMYAENTGVGSVLSPLEMMMPIGSDDSVSLRSFFILTLI